MILEGIIVENFGKESVFPLPKWELSIGLEIWTAGSAACKTGLKRARKRLFALGATRGYSTDGWHHLITIAWPDSWAQHASRLF